MRNHALCVAILTVPWLVGCSDDDHRGDCVPSAEICDGIDNDCDGTIDNGFECALNETRVCGSDVGECRSGAERCDASCTWTGVCEEEIAPRTEACDASGLDENCDGNANEGCACIDGETQACCGADPVVCIGGSFPTCSATPVEVCNGLDDDCDGLVDNGLMALEDSHEPNDTCAEAYALPGAVVAGGSHTFVATSYHADLTDDVDYYAFSVQEPTSPCLPASDQCYSIFFSLTDPAGGDVEFDVIVSPLLDDCENMSPSDVRYFRSTDDLPANELQIDWQGTCGFDDNLSFYVKVYGDPGGGVCAEYQLTVDYPADDSCP